MYIHVFLLGIYIWYIYCITTFFVVVAISLHRTLALARRGLSTVAPHLHLTGTAGGASEMVTLRGDLNWMVTIEEV